MVFEGYAASLADLLPFLHEGIFAQQLFGSSLGDYVLFLLALALFFFVGKLVVFIFRRYMRTLAMKTKNKFDDIVVEVLSKPLKWLFILGGFYVGIRFLKVEAGLLGTIDTIISSIVLLSLAWIAWRFVDSVIKFYLVPFTKRTKTELDDQLISLIKNIARAAIVVIVVTMILSELGYNVDALVAGLGISGLAFAFASKETIADMFGGISIYTSRPFVIGDFIKAAGVEGEVSEIGLTHTRILTDKKHLVTIPNRKLAGSAIENISKAPAKRIELLIGLNNASLETLTNAMRVLRDIINAHKGCEKEPVIILQSISGSSINLALRYWIKDKKNYLGVSLDIVNEIKKRFDAEKIELASIKVA
jgi:MscS family membrane protein